MAHLFWLLSVSSKFSPALRSHATALAAIGLAALGAVGFAGLRAHTALAARLDILAGALDAVPEAQLVVAADGRVVFANVAFQRFFPDKSEATLEHIERILATDPQAVTRLPSV